MLESDIKKVLKKQKITDKNIKKYEKEAHEKQLSLEMYLIANNIMNEEDLYKDFAKLKKLEYVNLKEKTIDKEVLILVPEMIASNHSVVAFEKLDGSLNVATTDSDNLQTFDFLHKKLNLEIKIYITTPTNIKEALGLYHKDLKSKFNEIVSKQESITKDLGKQKKKIDKSKYPVTKIVDAILENAIFSGASDIHIEPVEKEIIIRYRVDGILNTEMTLPKEIHPELVSRLKVLSKLKIDEHRKPQDGRFKIKNDKYNVSFRVSIVPMFDGEKIVMRLLDENNKIISLEQLGIGQKERQTIIKNIARPNGIILVTGPTGSGKTTTLYTILSMLNTKEVNICTIEDPIEYRIPGINQSQINPKVNFTFANGLRSFLRQDPDIIMVGEIRDQETADIAIHAAMTGHLVLSTLHTNDAVTCIPRLTELGVQGFLISSTLKIAIAQRLVRRLCPECKEKNKLTAKEYNKLGTLFDLEAISKTLKKHKIIKKTQSLKSIPVYKNKGCNKCGSDGYKGRIGIYEFLDVNDEFSKIISKNLSTKKLQQTAKDNGMLTLTEDGFRKVINGETTFDEILRVTKE